MQNQKLPNATTVLILGISSILTCCCYGVGVILGIIGLVLANKDLKIYQEDPSLYSNYSNLKIGRVLSIIGIVVSALYIVYVIVLFSTIGLEGIQDMQQEMMRRYGNQ